MQTAPVQSACDPGLAYTPRHFKRNMVFCAVGYLLINIVLVVLFASFLNGEAPVVGVISGLVGLGFNGFCVGYALRFLFQLDRVIEAAANRTDVEAAHLHPALAAMAGSLRYTNQELHNAVDQAVRDERLKTELITNVSHELKDPDYLHYYLYGFAVQVPPVGRKGQGIYGCADGKEHQTGTACGGFD